MSTCKGCGASIRWETTTYGKKIPLDPEPVPLGNLFINEDGKVESWNQHVGRSVLRYQHHKVTCPNADEF